MTALREEPGWYGEGGGADGMYASRTMEANRGGGQRTTMRPWHMVSGSRCSRRRASTGNGLATARRAEELGYATLLMPDGPHLPSPMPALAIAAGATTSLQVGTYVLASPLRAPRLAAWDVHTLSLLSPGSPFTSLGLRPLGAPTPGPPFRARRPSRRPGSPGLGR